MSFNKYISRSLCLVLFFTTVSFAPPFMPIKVFNFIGFYDKTKQQIRVSWQATSENSIASYMIERRKPIGEGWDILAGMPTTGTVGDYDFLDVHPLPINHYRLRFIDRNGKSTVSKAITVSTDVGNKFRAYPILVRDTILKLEGVVNTDSIRSGMVQVADSTFHIFNVLGQTVVNGKTKTQIDVSVLPRGVYIVKIGAEQALFLKQ